MTCSDSVTIHAMAAVNIGGWRCGAEVWDLEGGVCDKWPGRWGGFVVLDFCGL